MSDRVVGHGENVQFIEHQVDETRANVVQANRELLQAAEYQASYRRTVCIAAACIVALIAAIVIPLVMHFFPQGGGPPPF